MSNLAEMVLDTISSKIKELDKDTVINKKILDNIIAFCSLATGSGNSSVLENVAYEISNKDFKVCIVDMNIQDNAYYNGKFSKDGNKSEMDLVDYIGKDIEVSKIVNKGSKIDYYCSNDRNIKDLIEIDSKEYASKVVNFVKQLSILYDIVFLDIPYDIDNETINSLIYRCDRAFLVIDENYRSIVKSQKWIENCRITGIEIENRVNYIFNKKTDIRISKSRLEGTIGKKPIVVLPYTKDLIESGLSNRLLLRDMTYTDSKSREFNEGIKTIVEFIIDSSKTDEELEEEFRNIRNGKEEKEDTSSEAEDEVIIEDNSIEINEDTDKVEEDIISEDILVEED